MLKSTHCSSNHEFDDVSKTLRMVAFAAETMTAANMSHASRFPIQVVKASMTRVDGSNAFRNASKAPTRPLPSVTGLGRPPAFLVFVLSPGHDHGVAPLNT
jgi:hypothetical protein